MKLAAISDIHDNIWSLARVLQAIAGEGVDALLVLGDLCAPFTLRDIGNGFAGPVHAIFGNNDGDHFHLMQVAAEAGNVTLYGPFAELTFADARVALVHYPELARGLAASGSYRAVFYGHSHKAEVNRVGECVAINPGQVIGRLGPVTYAICDLAAGVAELREVPAGRWVVP